MSARTIAMTDSLYEYVISVSGPIPDYLHRLRDETQALPMGMMQISIEQGKFMALLVKATGVKKALEVGVFTGYSSLVVAQALPADGKLLSCDVSEEWTSIGQKYWKEAGVANKIDLRIAPALETLDGLLQDGQAATFDFMFIDADKENYDNYYERGLKLVRPGGIIAFDNTLWSGKVADPTVQDEMTNAIRALNAKLSKDPRIDLAVVPIGDGLSLALKK
jgi:predicted O-methyltransferase YrrM